MPEGAIASTTDQPTVTVVDMGWPARLLLDRAPSIPGRLTIAGWRLRWLLLQLLTDPPMAVKLPGLQTNTSRHANGGHGQGWYGR